jgi:tryptophan 7-halogenase
MPIKPLTHIIILGGGTSGWIAACMLAKHLKPEKYKIQVIESEDIQVIGVGESTIPPFVRLLQHLGIDEREFLRETQACFKLGIQFVDWRERNHSYFHPFGVIGKPIEAQDFYQCWLKAQQEGMEFPLQDFSPCAVMAKNNRFFLPSQAQNTPLGGANYAIHLDAKSVVHFLRAQASKAGVTCINATVTQVHSHTSPLSSNNGFIDSLVLNNGEIIHGDFFIDCSGFKSVLLGQHLQIPFEDWSSLLPCNRAVVVKTEKAQNIPPYTLAKAQKNGWSWRIPLQNSVGHGYVYSSDFSNDADATSLLMQQLEQKRINDPHIIPFTCGRREKFWQKNCLALGLSAGFVEPLESTAIHMIVRGMELFLRYFPDQECDDSLQREYNRRMLNDYEEVRDFVMLHYCTSQRSDTPFWRAVKNIPLPDSLRERIELFSGKLREGSEELFRHTSWQSVFEGMGIRPRKYSPLVDNIDPARLQQDLNNTRSAIVNMVKTLPTHDEYLQKLHQEKYNS